MPWCPHRLSRAGPAFRPGRNPVGGLRVSSEPGSAAARLTPARRRGRGLSRAAAGGARGGVRFVCPPCRHAPSVKVESLARGCVAMSARSDSVLTFVVVKVETDICCGESRVSGTRLRRDVCPLCSRALPHRSRVALAPGRVTMMAAAAHDADPSVVSHRQSHDGSSEPESRWPIVTRGSGSDEPS